MNKNIIYLTGLVSMCALTLSEGSALMLKATNNTDKPKYLFIRPTQTAHGNAISPHKVILPSTSPGTEYEIKVDDSQLGITGYYDVIAADNEGDPDWKLLGGTCKELHKDVVQHIIVDSIGMGLKTTCEIYGK